jgi:hypothetical protein
MSAARGGFATRLFALAVALSAAVVMATAAPAFGQSQGGGSKQPEGKPAKPEDKPTDKPGKPGAGKPGAGADEAQPASPAAGGASGGGARGAQPTAAAAPASGAPSNEVPVNIRLRQLEQRVQALKERAWRAKARVEMLKEAVLGGGIGARAGIQHINKMGSSYRLVQLIYALDGTTIFTRKDDSGAMHDLKNFDVLSGPITPGSHTLSVLAIYRGHGYGVFRYLKKYKFTVKSSHTFTVDEGKGLNIRVIGYERGGTTTPLEDRPALDFQVNVAKE